MLTARKREYDLQASRVTFDKTRGIPAVRVNPRPAGVVRTAALQRVCAVDVAARDARIAAGAEAVKRDRQALGVAEATAPLRAGDKIADKQYLVVDERDQRHDAVVEQEVTEYQRRHALESWPRS